MHMMYTVFDMCIWCAHEDTAPAGALGFRKAEVDGFAILKRRLHCFVVYLLRACWAAGLWGEVPVIDGPVHHHWLGLLSRDVHLQHHRWSV